MFGQTQLMDRARGAFMRLAALLLTIAANVSVATAESSILYAGSYTSGQSKGIYAWRFDMTSGALSSLGLVAEAPQPAHIWISPNGKYLYAVNWETDGGVSSFAIDAATARLTFLNRVSSRGAKPNQIVLDPSGRIAVTVNYASGTLAAYRILSDGRLSEAFFVDQHVGTSRSAHAGARVHGAEFTKDGSMMYVAELGLDRVYAYRVDANKGEIIPADPAFVELDAGAGPRRLQLAPDDRFLYVNHETDSKVSVFAVRDGTLTHIQKVSTLPPGVTVSNTTAEIMIDRAGRHLYVSNRGHDSIAVFEIDPASGLLTWKTNVPSGGQTPRNIRLDPTGRYLLSANEKGGTITVFKVDAESGMLTPTDTAVDIDTPGGMYFLELE